MLYQYDEVSKLSIDVISDTNALRVLVKDYLLSTIRSVMLLCRNFVRTKRRHFVTVSCKNKLGKCSFKYFDDHFRNLAYAKIIQYVP